MAEAIFFTNENKGSFRKHCCFVTFTVPINCDKVLVDFRSRQSLSAGNASASGQHDVGHKGVATGRGVLSL
ncbi:hypothetical protein [Lentibacillus persicus]|uniref:hypothetical protein n=1 Tax=Lentibacillus persicus TaxID=640948 RepID=UPI001C431DDF|nr:hypothetical protein [Lentibacillus persicus]